MSEPTAKLVGDIGGTNARFALLDQNKHPHLAKTYPTSQYESLADAILQYLSDVSVKRLEACSIAVATRVLGDSVAFTNNDRWSFSINALAKRLCVERLHIINDFTAQALAIPRIPPENLRKIGTGQAQENEPIGLLGPGTGLGVGALIPQGEAGQWRPLNSEGGHCTAAVSTHREQAVFEILKKRFGRVSYERFLSGPGLVNIVTALREIEGVASQVIVPEDVTRDGLSGADEQCVEALHLFCGLLGSYAGDLSLILGASGGVYVGGGIVPRLGDFIVKSQFRERFESKGRVSDELITVPTFVINAPFPGLVGATQMLN